LSWFERILPGLAAYRDVHPMVVHFPVALFPIAMLFAWLALLRPRSGSASTARLLLLLGTLGAAVSVATGLVAEEAMPHGSGTPVSVHRSFMIAVGILAVVLSVVALRHRKPPEGSELRTLCVGLVLLNVLLVLGADRGAFVARSRRAGSEESLRRVEWRPHEAIEGAAARGDSAVGRALFARLECASCHGAETKAEAPGIPPTLEHAGSTLRSEWMIEYLVEPHRIRWADHRKRPALRMPDFQLEPKEAADLSAYLATCADTARFPSAPVEKPPLTEEEAREGRYLVARYACRGCHVIGGSGEALGPDLDAVGDRLRPAYIYTFLMDPHGIIPGTPMKDFHLWEAEARSLTAYLSTLRAERQTIAGGTSHD
jgi:mono/diheme cytochrome c family protein